MVKDKTILVTGGGRGIGRAIARLLGSLGANVIVNDLGGDARGEGQAADPATEVTEEIRAAGGKAEPNTESITSWDAARRMVEHAVKAFGRLDGVVNCAGILRDAIFHKMTEDDWDQVLGVHLKGSFNVSRAAAERFRAQNDGVMVHMTSTAGLIGNLGQANYAAAKLGIVGLSRSIAIDMQRFGVRSNCVAPFAWSRLIGTIPEGADEAQRRRLDRMREMKPEQVAPLVACLLGEPGRDVTGQIFCVRGNEIFLMSQSRVIRGVHTSDGWTAETVAARALPALRPDFYGLETSPDVFGWDPV